MAHAGDDKTDKTENRPYRAVLLIPGQTRAVECHLSKKDLLLLTPTYARDLLVSVTQAFGKDNKHGNVLKNLAVKCRVMDVESINGKDYRVICSEKHSSKFHDLCECAINELFNEHFCHTVCGPVLIMNINVSGEGSSLSFDEWKLREGENDDTKSTGVASVASVASVVDEKMNEMNRIITPPTAVAAAAVAAAPENNKSNATIQMMPNLKELQAILKAAEKNVRIAKMTLLSQLHLHLVKELIDDEHVSIELYDAPRLCVLSREVVIEYVPEVDGGWFIKVSNKWHRKMPRGAFIRRVKIYNVTAFGRFTKHLVSRMNLPTKKTIVLKSVIQEADAHIVCLDLNIVL